MKALLWFWVSVLAVVGGGALALQLMGAPGPAGRAAAVPAGLEEPAPGLPGRVLPRVGPGGETAARDYAARAPDAGGRARIVLVIDGVGLDQRLSEQVLRDLPPAVDVAFSAYTPDGAADGLREIAARTGHECLVSIPMEPAGTPLAEEGPRSLTATADPSRNQENLVWALSRVAHCVGATGASDGLAGERFAESGPPFAAMLREVRGRGLLYLDPRPDAGDAGDAGVRRADVVVDRTAGPAEPVTAAVIDGHLSELETAARARGIAVGIAGPPLPVLLARLSAWARTLSARGLVLVPLSSVH